MLKIGRPAYTYRNPNCFLISLLHSTQHHFFQRVVVRIGGTFFEPLWRLLTIGVFSSSDDKSPEEAVFFFEVVLGLETLFLALFLGLETFILEVLPTTVSLSGSLPIESLLLAESFSIESLFLAESLFFAESLPSLLGSSSEGNKKSWRLVIEPVLLVDDRLLRVTRAEWTCWHSLRNLRCEPIIESNRDKIMRFDHATIIKYSLSL